MAELISLIKILKEEDKIWTSASLAAHFIALHGAILPGHEQGSISINLCALKKNKRIVQVGKIGRMNAYKHPDHPHPDSDPLQLISPVPSPIPPKYKDLFKIDPSTTNVAKEIQSIRYKVLSNIPLSPTEETFITNIIHNIIIEESP